MCTEVFTPREMDVLNALCSIPFRTQVEIAKDLGISQRTLRTHVSTMLDKSGMHDQRELVVNELHRRLAKRNTMTRLRRSGARRLAVIEVTTVEPSSVKDAVAALRLAGDAVYVHAEDVDLVLDGLE